MNRTFFPNIGLRTQTQFKKNFEKIPPAQYTQSTYYGEMHFVSV